MYCNRPRMLNGIRRADEANSNRGIPVAKPERNTRTVTLALMLRLSVAFPLMRRNISAGITTVDVSIVNPVSGPAGATLRINP